MTSVLDLFNNREKALIIWLLIFSLWILWRQDTRKALNQVIQIFLSPKIIQIITAVGIYVGIVTIFLYRIGFWDISLTKDTAFWLIGTGFIMVINVGSERQDVEYFKQIFFNNLKLILVIEFILNTYTFGLLVEVILLPTLIFLYMLHAVAGDNKETQPVKQLLDIVLAIIGFVFAGFAFRGVLSDFYNLTTVDNLKVFFLPILLSIFYIPFLYFFALFVAYELLFVNIDIWLARDKALAKFTKRRILLFCRLNLRKLNKFSNESARKIRIQKDKAGVRNLLDNFSKGVPQE